MKYHHIRLHSDLAMPLFMGELDRVLIPMDPQPTGFSGGWLEFGDQVRVLEEEYPCPFAAVGHGILFYLDGNLDVFFHARARAVRIVSAADVELPAYWDESYGDGVCDSRFNPWLWEIRFSK